MKTSNKITLALIGLTALLFLISCEPPEVSQAKVYFQQDNNQKAETQLLEAKEKYPDNPEVHYLLASRLYAPEGEIDKALNSLNKAIELDSTYKQKVSDTKLQIWGRLQNSAVTDFNESKDAIMPETTDSLLNESERKFEKALTITDTSSSTYLGIAQTNYQLGDSADVQKYASQAMEKGIFNENIINVYAATLDDPDEGIEKINAILEDHPDYTTLKIQKANFLIRLEKYDQAQQTVEDILEEDSENTSARFLLAQLYMEKGSNKKATQEYEKVLEKNPENPQVLARIAQTYFGSKNYPKAVQYSRDYVNLLEEQGKTEGLGVGYEILWKSLYNLGQTERAKEVRKKAQRY